MQSQQYFSGNNSLLGNPHKRSLTIGLGQTIPRQAVIGVLLVIALFAFEVFNFDTTRYALQNLLGDVNFFNFRWAAILALAFCAIDFAGLARLFTPQRGAEEPKEIWYLTGAWLLGATMNAIMTWWAVSLTLLNHSFGNEVLSREQLLSVVPIFVAVLVWLTRILFIGAFSVAGEHFFWETTAEGVASRPEQPAQPLPAIKPIPVPHKPIREQTPPGRNNISRPPTTNRPPMPALSFDQRNPHEI